MELSHGRANAVSPWDPSVTEGSCVLPLWMAESGRRPDVIQDHFWEKGGIPEVLYSAVEVADPPSPVSKKAAP